MSELQDALHKVRYPTATQKYPVVAGEPLAVIVKAARLVADPNIEAAAEAIYAIDYIHALVAVPKWKSASDGVKGTYRGKARAAVAAALTHQERPNEL